MKALIDTNVLIYDTFEDSLYHAEAKKLLDSLDEWIIPSIVVHEYVWFMRALKIEVKEVVHKVEEYLQHHKAELVNETSEDIWRALSFIEKEGLNLSQYNDKVILSLAIRVGSLATFDRKLRKQALAQRIQILPESI